MLAEDYPERNWPMPPDDEIGEHEEEFGYVLAEIEDSSDEVAENRAEQSTAPGVVCILTAEKNDKWQSGSIQFDLGAPIYYSAVQAHRTRPTVVHGSWHIVPVVKTLPRKTRDVHIGGAEYDNSEGSAHTHSED